MFIKMMEHKFVGITILVLVLVLILRDEAIGGTIGSSSGGETREFIGPRVAIRNLAGSFGPMNSSTNNGGVWVLIPNNLTESQLAGTNFDLFKLDTDELLGNLNGHGLEQESSAEQEREVESGSRPDISEPRNLGGRQSRKMKFFPNFMKKPKVSPLYLVNGTVCRFVNSQPICTTLATTGLFGNTRPILSNNGAFANGLFQPGQQGLQGLQGQQQQQQQLQNQFQQQGQQQGINQFQQGGQGRQTTPNFQG